MRGIVIHKSRRADISHRFFAPPLKRMKALQWMDVDIERLLSCEVDRQRHQKTIDRPFFRPKNEMKIDSPSSSYFFFIRRRRDMKMMTFLHDALNKRACFIRWTV